MASIKFTKENARTYYDQLPAKPNKNTWPRVLETRLAIVRMRGGYGFVWLDLPRPDVVGFLNISASVFYDTSKGAPVKKPIGVSVDYLYKSVQQELRQILANTQQQDDTQGDSQTKQTSSTQSSGLQGQFEEAVRGVLAQTGDRSPMGARRVIQALQGSGDWQGSWDQGGTNIGFKSSKTGEVVRVNVADM